MWALCTLNPTSWVKCLPAGVVWNFGEGMPVQVSSPSDCSSKLRGQNPNAVQFIHQIFSNVNGRNFLLTRIRSKQGEGNVKKKFDLDILMNLPALDLLESEKHNHYKTSLFVNTITQKPSKIDGWNFECFLCTKIM
ncbi:hypothetical protein AVEN_165205-1 [Araneus ventricosus]|uniref:Uncharacterized protein n=1 Tax=Araneus ventricosus TaxID=182803 RepID=A0A4Y2B6F1_ARAVE|nr:hypothetical protein AVEN_165205-1 [Araneus ventricosus]